MTGTCIALAAPLQAMQPRPCPSVTGAPESVPLVPSSPGAVAPPTRQLAAGKAGPGAPRKTCEPVRRGRPHPARTPEPGTRRPPGPQAAPGTLYFRNPTPHLPCPTRGPGRRAPTQTQRTRAATRGPGGCLAREDPAARNVASGVAAPHPDPSPPGAGTPSPTRTPRPAAAPPARAPQSHLVPAPPGCVPAVPGSRTRRPPPAAAASSVLPQPRAPPSPPPSSRRPDSLSAPAQLATPLLGAYRKRRRPRPEAPPPLQPVDAL